MSLASFELAMFAEQVEFRAAKWLQWVCSPIVLLVGSLANCLSVWILARRVGRNGTHNYLLALGVADQVTLLSGLLKSWISALIGDDCAKLSLVICIGGNFLSTASTYLSVYLIAAVTIERVFVLFSQLPVLNTAVARARRVIAGLVVGCLTVNIHWFFVLDIYSFHWRPDSNRTHTICYLRPQLLRHLKQPLAWIDFLLYSLIPILLIVICNVLIIYRVYASRRRYNRELREASQDRQAGRPLNQRLVRSNSLNRSVNQVTVMLLLVSCFFIVTSLPITVLKVLSSLSSVIDSAANNNPVFYSRYQLAQACAELLMYINHSANFFFYCLAAKKFRNDLASCFRGLRLRCKYAQ